MGTIDSRGAVILLGATIGLCTGVWAKFTVFGILSAWFREANSDIFRYRNRVCGAYRERCLLPGPFMTVIAFNNVNIDTVLVFYRCGIAVGCSRIGFVGTFDSREATAILPSLGIDFIDAKRQSVEIAIVALDSLSRFAP